MVNTTPWEKYGPGNDPRCADCMMHVGFETTPVLGAKRQLGDTWKMLKWQFSGSMGGHPNSGAGNGGPTSGHTGGGTSNTTLMPPPPNTDLVSSDGRLRVL
jgi:hypothetical protein